MNTIEWEILLAIAVPVVVLSAYFLLVPDWDDD